MRNRLWLTFAFIVILSLVSGWIALPGSAFDIGGFRASHPVREGLDLQGGLQVVLQAQPVAGQAVDAETLDGTRATLERRVNNLGVSEPLIQTRGSDQIIVELPGVDDPQEAINILQETALLEFIDPQGQYLPPGLPVNTSLGSASEFLQDAADPLATPSASPVASPSASPVASPSASPVASPVASPAGIPLADAVASPAASPVAVPAASPVGSTAAEAAASPIAGATDPLDPLADGPVYATIASGAGLRDAYVTTDQSGISQVVGFEFQGDAAGALCSFTSENLGAPMTIVVDKVVISSPQINGAICGPGVIQGVPPQEVNDLVIQLKAGALDLPLEVVQSRTVGPTLGQDSVDRSLVAGVVGLGMVALFMVLYYRLPGVLSVVALLIYTAVTFAIFKLIPVTLTLAGIAGFILSIGMAVDANVLIFARLKEELRRGRSLAGAVEAGFDHAWPSIRDSNITTMITTFILYLFGSYTGTSIITGFAVTLFIGVAVSMFTAITVSRTFLRLIVAAGVARDPWWFGISRTAAPAPAPTPTAAD